MKKTALFSCSLVLLAGCAAMPPGPTQQEMITADYGVPPEAEKIEDIVRKAIGRSLNDPYSAVYTHSEPRKAWWYSVDKQPTFGYAICGTVNAKNRMGGYVGPEPYIALYKNGMSGGHTQRIATVGGEAIVKKCSAPMQPTFFPVLGF